MAEILTDGHPTIFGLAASWPDPDGFGVFGVLMCEKRVKPIGIDSGGFNDTTCMRNLLWRTRQPKRLVTLTEMSLTVNYDPAIFENGTWDSWMRNNMEMAIGWPDGSYVTFWGFIDKFEPNEISEGAQPEATVTVVPTNQDDASVEQPPIYYATH